MRYQVTVTETVHKYAVIEADSIEKAKSKGYDAARAKAKPDEVGPTSISVVRLADKEYV